MFTLNSFALTYWNCSIIASFWQKTSHNLLLINHKSTLKQPEQPLRFIDDCSHTFADLAATVLPYHLEHLHDARQCPWPASVFSQPGYGVASIAKELGLDGDFSGCYVLQEGHTPIYVGISRGVLNRLRQHMLGRDHFSASLAYAMAKKDHQPTEKTRKLVMGADGFGDAFGEAQTYLRSLSIGAVEITNPLELYVFEAYAAMALGTAEWNTFRTH